MRDKKFLIGFYDKSLEEYMNILNGFDENGYVVHVFDNLDEETLKTISIEQVLSDVIGDIEENNINIISNNFKFILKVFKENSFKYNSFIYDNKPLEAKYSKEANKTITYKYNNNLYFVNNDRSKFGNYSKLNGYNLYNLTYNQVINFINSVKEAFIANEIGSYFYKIENKANKIKSYIQSLNQEEKSDYERIFEKYPVHIDENILYRIYMNSFLFYTFEKKIYADQLLRDVLKLNEETGFFVMYQLISKSFTNSIIGNSLDESIMDRLYENIYEKFKTNIEGIKFISKEERNEELVVVFISQFLTMEHGPTKTVLDRCYALKKYLNKRVILINTTELITSKGLIPMNSIAVGNIIENYQKLNKISYKDIEIEYYQPKCSMPDINECMNIINFIKKEKPYLLINIGGYSIAADLSAQIVPMATISTSGNFSISKNKGDFFIMGKKAEKSDYDIVESLGKTKESIIETEFTYTMKPQENNYTREMLNIPEDKFVIAVIGARLEQEIDEEFLKYLDILAQNGCYVLTIGNYNLSKKMREKYSCLAQSFKGLGFQSDILACIDLIDIYINPRRQGGGGSAVECMYKEKPALSLKYGDVSQLVDKEFLEDTYDGIVEKVLKCKNNSAYYNMLKERAKVKAQDLMDTKKYFLKAYNQIISSSIFK